MPTFTVDLLFNGRSIAAPHRAVRITAASLRGRIAVFHPIGTAHAPNQPIVIDGVGVALGGSQSVHPLSIPSAGGVLTVYYGEQVSVRFVSGNLTGANGIPLPLPISAGAPGLAGLIGRFRTALSKAFGRRP